MQRLEDARQIHIRNGPQNQVTTVKTMGVCDRLLFVCRCGHACVTLYSYKNLWRCRECLPLRNHSATVGEARRTIIRAGKARKYLGYSENLLMPFTRKTSKKPLPRFADILIADRAAKRRAAAILMSA